MGPVTFYKGLRFKIVLGLISLLTFTMTILFIVQYFHHRKKMITHLQENISPHLTQIVNDVLKSSMLSKNKGEMKYILETVRQYPDVKNIFILNRTGRVVTSINDQDTGRTIDIRDPTCQVCHHGTATALNKTVIYTSPQGEKIFRNVNPIYNQRECFSCHKPEEKIAGVLVTDFTLDPIEKQLRAEFKENILLLVLAVGISTFVIGIALNHLVIRKLQHFVEAASSFGRGEFWGTICFKSDDEIQRLAESFNRMAKELREKMGQERTYLSQIIDAQENERRRISRELHDEIGQALYAVKFNLEMIDRNLPEKTSSVRERLEEAKSLSSQTLSVMRRLSLDLRPTMLDDLGLVPTLRWYIQNFSNRLGICSTFETIGLEEKLSPQLETGFYRIVQEALNNIAKHAQADQVEISLVKRNSRIFASVQDNGRGFDLDKVLHARTPERGFGIVGIQERVSLLGGQVEIQSKPGFGTLISVEIPCERVRDGNEKDTSATG